MRRWDLFHLRPRESSRAPTREPLKARTSRSLSTVTPRPEPLLRPSPRILLEFSTVDPLVPPSASRICSEAKTRQGPVWFPCDDLQLQPIEIRGPWLGFPASLEDQHLRVPFSGRVELRLRQFGRAIRAARHPQPL